MIFSLVLFNCLSKKGFSEFSYIIIYRNIGLHFRIVSIEPRGKEPPVEAMINMVLTQM